jgi:hypothetical protein
MPSHEQANTKVLTLIASTCFEMWTEPYAYRLLHGIAIPQQTPFFNPKLNLNYSILDIQYPSFPVHRDRSRVQCFARDSQNQPISSQRHRCGDGFFVAFVLWRIISWHLRKLSWIPRCGDSQTVNFSQCKSRGFEQLCCRWIANRIEGNELL